MTKLFVICVFAFSLFVLFYNLDGHYLVDWDEAWYVVMAQRAIEDGNYLFLRFQNQVFWDKSPLSLYPMILSFKLFGVNEGTARLGSAVIGFGLLLQVFFLARRYFGPWTAALSVLIVVTTVQLVFNHGLRNADIDSITLFFLTGAVSSWVLFRRGSRRVVFTALCLSGAALCKGPIVVIPILVIAAMISAERVGRKEIILKEGLTCLAMTCFIVLPWYVYMYVTFGHEFIRQHILKNFIARYTERPAGFSHSDMFYIDTMLSPENWLWYGAALTSLLFAVRVYAEERKTIDLCLIVWAVGAFLVVNGSQSQQPWYVFPLYLPLAILTARALVAFVQRGDYLNKLVLYLGLVVTVTYFFNREVFPRSTGSNIVKALLLVLALGALVSFIGRRMPHWKNALSIVLVAALCFVPVLATLQKLNFTNTVPPIAPIVERLDPGVPITTLFLYSPSAVYYLSKRGPVREVFNLDDIEHLKGQRVVTTSQVLETVRASNAGRSLQFDHKGKSYSFTPIASAKGFEVVRVN